MRLAFIGDLMLGRGVSRQLRHKPPEWFLGDVLPLLRSCDAVIANLECPITDGREARRFGWKFFHFRADPAAIRILQCANVRFVCLANNHTLDFGPRGLTDTIAALDAAGIHHAGAGRNAAEAAAPVILPMPAAKVGLMAATDGMPAFAAGPARPGSHVMEFTQAPDAVDWVARSVRSLRDAGADLIVLSLHWGPNLRRRPSRWFRAFAQAAIDAGVDVLHGHSAHVVQAIERHGRGVILYDTGNFIDDYWKFPFRKTTWSFVFLFEVEAGALRRLQLVPVRIHHSPLGLATGATFDAINAHMKELCAAVGTEIRANTWGLEVPLG
jgi:poly-gamma-glutamate capsule biosynthesis protein CapA/YwtB (metallophosphatase superfamily)